MRIKQTTFKRCRRTHVVSSHLALPALCCSLLTTLPCPPAEGQQGSTPPVTPAAASPQGEPAARPSAPNTTPVPQTPPAVSPVVPSPSSLGPRPPTPPDVPRVEVQGETVTGSRGNEIHVRGGVTVTYAGITLVADSLDGRLNGELVFSGHARIERAGGVAHADAIHFFPGDGRFRLDNPRGVLDPSVLAGRIDVPVFLTGGDLYGNRSGYSLADRIIATTCQEHFHHYELRISNAELIPYKRIILRKVGVYFFGVKLITLPEIIIPLDEKPGRRPRTEYAPEFGENSFEGYFARFPYVFSEGGDAATFVRADVTQKQGLGYRFEQEYLAGKQPSLFNTSGAGYGGGLGVSPAGNGAFSSAYGYGTIGSRLSPLGTGVGPQNGGLLSLQGYFADGFNRNFNGSFKHQQSIGGSNRFDFSTEIQNNSFFLVGAATSSSRAQTSKFDFAHDDTAHGVTVDGTVSLATSSNTGSGSSQSSNQLTGTLHQAYQFDTSASTRNSLTFDMNFAHLLNTNFFTTASTTSTSTTSTSGTSASGTSSSITSESVTRSERFDPSFELQHLARDYSWTLDANDSIPIGPQTGNSTFGTLEKLPELLVSTSTYNYRGGWLRNIPTDFQFGIGQYSEPSTNERTDRVLMAFTLQPFTILKGQTEVVTGGGFEQHIYGDGAAEYIVHDSTRLREHLFGRSGIDLTYDYQQPEGASPFQFDQFQHSHSLTAQAGYLDDKNFQATVRVGYDLLGTSSAAPWQSLSTNLMWRPSPSTRYDLSSIYDPNLGKFLSYVGSAKFRSRNNFAFDIITNIDPSQPGILHKFTQINTQFDIPIAHRWRLTGLLDFSGLTKQFVSRNIEISHDWDCLEATFTYTETIGGFQPDRQFYLAIRIKGLPFSRAFSRGSAGQALGTGVGNIF